MKVNVEIDISPEELRKFIGLPNVEALQSEFVKLAGQYLENAVKQNDVARVVSPLLSAAIQPWANYQRWLTEVMTGKADSPRTGASDGKGFDAKT